jgi:hypothetical protein
MGEKWFRFRSVVNKLLKDEFIKFSFACFAKNFATFAVNGFQNTKQS